LQVLGAVISPNGIGSTLFIVALGIGSVLALMVGLTSLAHYYNVPIKEKTTKFAWATLVTYILAMIVGPLKPAISFILFLAFMVLLIRTKRDVYVYTGQASSIFNLIAKIYARTSRKIANPHSGGSGNTIIVMDQETYVYTGILMMSFALLLSIVIWFTLEPIAWILWGFTGK